MHRSSCSEWEQQYEKTHCEGLALVNIIDSHMAFMSDYCEGNYIAIGGIALYRYLREKGLYPMDLTKDGDVIITNDYFPTFKYDVDVTSNIRLGKHEYHIPEHEHIDIDAYVEFTPNLTIEIPMSSLIRESRNVDGLMCINKIHLLALKLDKMRDFTGSHESAKWRKIVRDNLLMLSLMSEHDMASALWVDTITGRRKELLLECLADVTALQDVAAHHPLVKIALRLNAQSITQREIPQLCGSKANKPIEKQDSCECESSCR